ncbi:protein BIG GRAIN 1-like B [Henckelia pumila]|uniref:protein BIG GRAIN 1-like B n=1 Tax=Henckelia pumila TaxID=405737 RepID=UPI003C6DF230
MIMVDKYYYCRSRSRSRSRRDHEMSDQLLYSNTNINHHPAAAAASFSSTLLDEIYRSIDNIDEGAGGDQNIMNNNAMRKKQQQKQSSSKSSDHELEENMLIINFQRAACISMMEKNKKNVRSTEVDAGSWQRQRQRQRHICSDSAGATNKNHIHAGFNNTKKSVLNLKNIKVNSQPISPGARLAGFFNSLFTSKTTRSNNNHNNNSPSSSSSSSSSSNFSARSSSCLSKTTRGIKSDQKRSVQDFQINKQYAINEDLNNRRLVVLEAELAARDFLRNYQKKLQDQAQFDDDEDDDAASYASSDLFELDHLERYREELPVYETTHLHTNRPIAASGFIL